MMLECLRFLMSHFILTPSSHALALFPCLELNGHSPAFMGLEWHRRSGFPTAASNPGPDIGLFLYTPVVLLS